MKRWRPTESHACVCACALPQPPLQAAPAPTGAWGKVVGFQRTCYRHASVAWDKLSYVLNFEWLALGRMPSLILFTLLIIGLSLTVGLTASSVKDGVTLGVEFGGGYQLM